MEGDKWTARDDAILLSCSNAREAERATGRSYAAVRNRMRLLRRRGRTTKRFDSLVEINRVWTPERDAELFSYGTGTEAAIEMGMSLSAVTSRLSVLRKTGRTDKRWRDY